VFLVDGKANMSTFLHEAGHAYLMTMADLAARDDVPQAFKDDYAQILSWLGSEDGNLTREQHEQFARGFEAYLFEGKAPSAELRDAFARFKSWLKSVYQLIAGDKTPEDRQRRIGLALRVELTPEIRGVFDRMLATDEEIAYSRETAGQQPMFRNPEEAGMGPVEWQRYLDAQQKAQSHAAKAGRLKALRDELREKDAELRERRELVKEQARLEYAQRPDVRAKRFVTTGELLDATGEDVFRHQSERVKLDREAVRALSPEAGTRLASFLTKKNGLHPDEVAEIAGFNSGREMLEAVLAVESEDDHVARRLEESEAENRTALEDRDRLAEEVEKGLHGDATLEWMLMELQALRSRTAAGPGGSSLEAIRRAAERLVKEMPVTPLSPHRALQAERAASEQAFALAARGDYSGAVVAKQRQILNAAIYREVRRATEMREKFLATGKRLSKLSARQNLGKAAPEYRDAADLILESLGVAEERTRERPLRGIASLLRRFEDDAVSVHFDTDLLEETIARKRPWDSLNVGELENAQQALRQIQVAARNANKIRIEGEEIDRESAIVGLVSELEDNVRKRPDISSSVTATTVRQKVGSFLHSVDGSLLRPAFLADMMGGKDNLDSMWRRLFFAPLQRAKAREREILDGVAAPLLKKFREMPDAVRSRWNEEIDGKRLFPSHRKDFPAPTRRFELILMALNVGNESNIERLLGGRQITLEEVNNALHGPEGLTQAEWAWVQDVWDASESLWPLSRDLEERLSGVAPEKIQVAPVKTRWGTLRGGYYPAVYDRRGPGRNTGERQAGDTLAALLDPSFTRPGTKHSHLKERAEHWADVIDLDPSSISAHLAQVSHDVAYREAIISAGRLLMDEQVQNALKERLGDEWAPMLLDYLRDVGQQRGTDVASQGTAKALTFILRKMRANMAIATLGYALDVAVGDLANLSAGLVDLKLKHWGAGMAQYVASPKQTRKWALEKSPELRTRQAGLADELRKRIDAAATHDPLKRGLVAWWKDHAFVFMEATDAGTATPLWIAAYRQNMTRLQDEGMGPAEADARAVQLADLFIQKRFPSGFAADQSAVLRDKGIVGSSLLFHGYFNVVYNLYRESVAEVVENTRELAEAEAGARGEAALRAGKASALEAARVLGLTTSIYVLGNLLTGRGPGDDEDLDDWLVRMYFIEPITSLPFADIGIAAIDEAKGRRSNVRAAPSLAVGYQAAKAIGLAFREGADPRRTAEAIAKVIAMLSGIPGARPIRAAGYLLGEDGLQEASGPFDAIDSLVYGQQPEQFDTATPASIASDLAGE